MYLNIFYYGFITFMFDTAFYYGRALGTDSVFGVLHIAWTSIFVNMYFFSGCK